MREVIEDFTSRVDLHSSSVLFPSPVVLLFGGHIPTDTGRPAISLRHVLYTKLLSTELFSAVKIPEKLTSWSEYGTYLDLIEFEKDLAYISSLIVLVVESPGAIAELGAFSVIDHLAKKLLVVVRRDLFDSPSFIRNGPIRFLENEHKNESAAYPWSVRYDPARGCEIIVVGDAEVNETADFVIHDIQERISGRTKSEKFSFENPSHVMALILDLIHTFLAIQEAEISHALAELDVSVKKLKRYLSILQWLELVRKERYGGRDYYMASTFEPRMKYSYRRASLDREAYQAHLSKKYLEADSKRSSAIKKYLGADS